MQKYLKRTLAFLLICMVICAWIPMTAQAAVGDSEWVENEPNNSKNLADMVYNDYTVDATVAGSDVDYYGFYVNGKSTVTVSIVGDNSFLQMSMETASSVLEYKSATLITGSGYYYGTSISRVLDTGTYYLCMKNTNTYSINDYTFYITITPHVHTPGNWTVTKAPSSYAAGTATQVCAQCGATTNTMSVYNGLNRSGSTILYVVGSNLVRNQWQLVGGAWYYFAANGQALVNAWMEDSQGWCYLGPNGYMLTNAWAQDSQGWCYVGPNGYCLTNCWMQDSYGWCYLGSDGRMITNAWIPDSQGWCYVGSDGYMVANSWVEDSYGWCYVGPDGRMVYNRWVADSYGWCYVGPDGYMMADGWVHDGKGWCYLDANGYMLSNGWVKDSVGWCYLGADGYMLTNVWVQDSVGWCYLGASGYQLTNSWVQDSYGWCYVDEDGYMVYNEWVQDSGGWCYIGTEGYQMANGWAHDGTGWFYLDANGYCLTNTWMLDSTGWCYLGADGYMVTDTWEMDSTGWHYINSSGYLSSHYLDWCYHSFAAATYFEPQTCSCGATRGEELEFPITLDGREPIYSKDGNYTTLEMSNFRYSITEGDNYIEISFDAKMVEKNSSSYSWGGARIELYDANGLVDSALYLENGWYLNEKRYNESVDLYLYGWDGVSPLLLRVVDYM